MLQRAAGIQLLTVPYKALPDVMRDLAAGQIDVMMTDPATAATYYKMGVRPLGTASAARLPQYPDVPTLQEEGVTGADAGGWLGAPIFATASSREG